MKHIVKYICTSLLLLTLACASHAQTTAGARAQNIFVELGGPGLLLSANYDTRFVNRHDGVGGRLGVGYLSISDNSLLTVPLQINYLLGRNNRYFELGIGATFVSSRGDENDFLSLDNAQNTIGTMTFGYRYQPEEGGFNFRAALNPVFNKHDFFPFFGGVSFGYTF
ncbi:hypothetical protein ABDD95_13345 [Mucilaginibacter sp. PAMB04274]|uniref:hypothetical protein n=1 Tax=Mucilaginibacter sp. PAMB04274 TaxID=3138568 RepID=UPI0031F6B72C